MAKASKKGQEEAHTQAPAAGAADAIDQLAADLSAVGANLPAELVGSPDVGDGDLFQLAAEISASDRRARGRPAGSANKRNSAMFDYLATLGHRHPAVTLSQIQTADTRTLARALGAKPIDVANMQVKAAAALLPFDLAKKVHVDMPADVRRPVMVIGELHGGLTINDDGTFSAGEKPNEINGTIVRKE